MEIDGSGSIAGDQSGAGRKDPKKRQGRIDLLFCVGVLGLGLVMGDSHRTTSKPQFLVFPPEAGANHYIVLRVVDGDTVHMGLVLDVGVRLHGIDTPERGQPGFKEATEKLKSLLSKSEYIRVEWRGRGKYGRQLGVLYPDEDGLSANEILVREGYAKEYLP